ncbi:SMI1/KNR4 family protein [Marinobacter xestospongiae]|uniref:SMI1/KNR4 family protein n=1 Tax=Marinobacter xestospongiae TaxID=994319 RepID=UPI002004AC75|nr:SMI1/KNR4 family protein [Marinobacter xestospongiae]MCK7566027.1 SMI1/KNR4 family protein [Marinobacter xestospongiae]
MMVYIEYAEQSRVHDYAEEAKRFEEITGFRMPKEYLDFLKENGSGLFPEPGYYDDLMEIGKFYDFCIDDANGNGILNVNKSLQADGRLTSNVLAFAETSDCHNHFCLVLDGVWRGCVVLLGDDSILLWGDYQVSDLDEKEDVLDRSFSEFISKLE